MSFVFCFVSTTYTSLKVSVGTLPGRNLATVFSPEYPTDFAGIAQDLG
jgi:hypothetical protein